MEDEDGVCEACGAVTHEAAYAWAPGEVVLCGACELGLEVRPRVLWKEPAGGR